MGLSASQARLLSLSNRQHTVENKAQALQQRKMLLANDQDKAYKTYLNALDNTTLKTLQTNSDTGAKTWITGSINNLLRNGTAKNTSGNVFFVQDLKTGQLYLPKELTYDIENAEAFMPNGFSEDGSYTPASIVYGSSSVGTKEIKTALTNVTGTTLEEQARSFAEQFGIVYTEYDVNEEVKLNYQDALNAGWNVILGYQTDEENDLVLAAYEQAVEKDRANYVLANNILSFIPEKNPYGIYDNYTNNNSLIGSYANHAKILLQTYAVQSGTETITVNCPEYTDKDGVKQTSYNITRPVYVPKSESALGYKNPYSAAELNIIRESLNVLDSCEKFFPHDQIHEPKDEYSYIDTNYTLTNLSAVAENGRKYLDVGYEGVTDEAENNESLLQDYQKYLLMLNGGTLTWTGKKQDIIGVFGTTHKQEEVDYNKSYDIYTQLGINYNSVLSSSGKNYANFGEALTDIFSRVANSTSFEDEFLAASTFTILTPNNMATQTVTYQNHLGTATETVDNPSSPATTYSVKTMSKGSITRTEIEKYKKYKQYKEQWLSYEMAPQIIEYIPNNKAKAEQYEQIYKALVSCGKNNAKEEDLIGKTDAEKMVVYAQSGYVECDDERSKNPTWVSNMIKNAQVIINVWDTKTEMLSKTSPALNTRLKQVSDNAKIEKASQDYEAELDLIKQKDNKYDVVLEQLETERNALQTEIDSLEEVINTNISKRFKVFG